MTDPSLSWNCRAMALDTKAVQERDQLVSAADRLADLWENLRIHPRLDHVADLVV